MTGANPRIVVTGLGLMTGLGLDLETSWRGLLAGETPAARFKSFDPEGLACPFGVELPDGANELFQSRIKKRHRSQMTRGTMLNVVTAQMAIEDAHFDGALLDRSRVGVVMGSTGTCYTWSEPTPDPQRILRVMPNAPAAWVSLGEKFGGPSLVVSTACSSGAYALAYAWMLIATGQCDAVIAGAGDSSINYLDVEGFGSLMALSEPVADVATASRPFDKERSGFVMGEGGGMLALETLDAAQRRGARVYAELHLPALTSETYNIVSPEPKGVGMAKAMSCALQNAALAPEAIDYINAHGTSTHLNDLYETEAIRQVFGAHAYSLAVSSTKSMTGHCLAGAAGVEAVVCCKAIEAGMLPPTANLRTPDPELDLDYVPNVARQKELRHAMSNSFAFGGHNGVCVFSKM
ncbi:MAG TPA: beta-ketoacyl-[acyl-carrier-protein] synthase family protein [Candidatus Hydrogenedentes bacterium]|nr:beta-ketoacyl-[acyl-carrier-protein] synthase family protein [Candidatus Hydrogenedentota bacterium]HOS01632.1 beta-ketoacyl-[acyl-carrier-protein] synthase family protein [Candidatus Hydrogenedentota bacterium]